MSSSKKERCLIIASCLMMSACTETIIREIPAAEDPLTPELAAVAPAIDSGVDMIPATTTIGSTANMVTDTSTTGTAVETLAVSSNANMVTATTALTANTTALATPVTTFVATQPTTTVASTTLTPTTVVPATVIPATTVTPATTVVPATVLPATTVTPATTVVPATVLPATTVTPATTVVPATVLPATTVTPATTVATTVIPATTVAQTGLLADPISGTSTVGTLESAVTTPTTSINPLTGLPVITSELIAANTSVQLLEPDTDMILGVPGSSVDCQQTLPCRWVSSDLQFSLTVTNADNIANLSNLSINYSITTAHDTQVYVSQADDAIDGNGSQFKGASQSLGGGNGGTPQGVIAGTPIQGILNFDAGTASNSISQWSISIMDGGMLRSTSFTGIPVGTVTTAQADCQNTLPCVWTTPSNDVAITLQSVGGVTLGSRLTANFSIETTTNTPVAVDAGSSAYGDEGTIFESRTHTVATDTNYLKVSASTFAGVPLFGSVNFYRTESVPVSLLLMSLIIYPDQPVPRWNPQFINVPVQ